MIMRGKHYNRKDATVELKLHTLSVHKLRFFMQCNGQVYHDNFQERISLI